MSRGIREGRALEAYARAAMGGRVQQDSPANIGRAVPMRTIPAAGGLVTLGDTQLISARVNEPMQWVVTLSQIQLAGAQSGPWGQNFDGTPYATPPAVFGVPVVPQQGGVTLSLLQVRVQWGIGGIRQTTFFDYPLQGGSFGITADTLEVDVALRSSVPQTAIDPAVVPVVGAAMVPGQSVDPLPLRWLEPEVDGVAHNTGVTWSVKPFARKVRITSTTAQQLFGSFQIVTGVANNLQLTKRFVIQEPVAGAGCDALLDLPAQCEAVGVTNSASPGGAAVNISAEWYMGLV